MDLKNLKLIAIHIKKTAGMSFKHVLRGAYGRKYYRMNINQNVEDRTEAFNQHLAEIPEDTRVVHGHFQYTDALPLYEAYPEVPVVTWLRDPVQRVVSRYFYSRRKYEEGLRREKDYLINFSLLEFAGDPRFANEMSRVMAGSDLADLAFVGLLEHLEEDVAYLAALLGWQAYKIPMRNTNVSYKSKQTPPSKEELEEIARLNQEDVDLYRYALELRKERLPIASL
jgi:hypothetical protein